MQREAVLAGGAGDYSSMMYGDKEATQGAVTPLSDPAAAVVKEKVEKEIEKGKVTVVEAAVPAAASSAPAAAPIGEHLSCICLLSSFLLFYVISVLFRR